MRHPKLLKKLYNRLIINLGNLFVQKCDEVKCALHSYSLNRCILLLRRKRNEKTTWEGGKKTMHFIKYSKTMQNRDGSVGGLEEKGYLCQRYK